MGVRVECVAVCIEVGCDWSAAGAADRVDRDAAKHGRVTKHGTDVSCKPVKG